MEFIVPHRSRGWKDFLYVCVFMCMCVCFTTLQVGISIRFPPNLVHRKVYLKVRSSSKMGYVGPIGTPRGQHLKIKTKNNFLITSPIFDLKVSLDRSCTLGQNSDLVKIYPKCILLFSTRKIMKFDILHDYISRYYLQGLLKSSDMVKCNLQAIQLILTRKIQSFRNFDWLHVYKWTFKIL